jgi:hypothetical protein
MAVDIKFLIDGADRGQPTNAEEFGVNISLDSAINARIVSFDNDLTFVGGTYEYIFNNLVDTGGCSLIDVEVQYQCAGVWKRLANGYIIVSECNFDLDKCQVKTKIYDDSFSTKINNNKSIPFYSNSDITKNLQTATPPTIYDVSFFNASNGDFDVVNLVGCIKIYDALKFLVSCMSDNFVDFESDYFRNQINEFGYGKTLMMTNGLAIRTPNQSPTQMTFDKLYEALNKKIRLGMVIQRQANGRPLLRIENYDYFQQLGESCNLYDQPNIKMAFDKSQLYAAVNFGSDPFLYPAECDGGNGGCTFPQIAFRGFRDETFGILGECNTANVMNLKSGDVVFDTNIIDDCFRFNNDQYDLGMVLVDANFFGPSNMIFADDQDPLGYGGHVYNSDYINEQVSQNWLGGFPNSLFQYLSVGFNPFDTIVIANSNYTVGSEPFWQIDFGSNLNYSTYNGTYIPFGNQFYDPNNLFDGQTYDVPFTGLYNVKGSIALQKILLGAANTTPRNFQVMVRRFDSSAALLQTTYSAFSQAVLGRFDMYCDFDVEVACNATDLIRIDIVGNFTTNTAGLLGQGLLNTATYNGQTRATNIYIKGEPFEPTALVDVDPNSVRRLDYSFDRPLRMEEIEAILDNTSRPIKFGQFDDPLRVIEGYINKVDIKSIIKQDASIQLKSNKILR